MRRSRTVALLLSLFLIAAIAVPQSSQMIMTPTGLQFPDASTQSTAGAPLSHNHLGQTWSGPTGLRAEVSATDAKAFLGKTSNTTLGTAGVYGWVSSLTSQGAGVFGLSTSDQYDSAGVFAQIGTPSNNSAGVAIRAYTDSNNSDATAVFAHVGTSTAYDGAADGVYAAVNGRGNAVWGVAAEPTATAGRFTGNVVVTGTLSKGGGAFKIDHPLDPVNKYLYHSFVESPDMKNVYDGVVALDDIGEAVVELPDYFEALNRDFRYQLTSIGAPSPELHIAEPIKENRFRISGGHPRGEVSWQVTGIRKDVFANAHRIPVEEMKPDSERGRYLHAEEFGIATRRETSSANYQTSRAGGRPARTPKPR